MQHCKSSISLKIKNLQKVKIIYAKEYETK